MIERSLSRTKGELSEFLLRHRQKLMPADVGLPSGGRRRTPGLRREEVAALAGVGLTWYTWFEQGRDIQVSEKFLLSLSYALKLDDAECSHLFLLAHKRPPPPEAHHLISVTPLIQQLLDDLQARPAYVLNLRWDVIAWNAAADTLFGFSQRHRDTRNFLRMLFSAPDMRRRLPAWGDDAPRLLAQFRYDFAVAPGDPAMLALVDDLKRLSPAFRKGWQTSNGEIARRGISSVENTDGVRMDFQHETLVVDQHRHLKMLVYFATPSDQ
ncbi:helix-turn-helix transcriptional regulator [Stutzerimonas kirkiae]|uniref:Transcriptional regulator n=1 Tax=Stutzerimonas kirkiae TaxID=2211392 RepID=A0A4Q9R5K2_9GAMM|nr:helix-turn-helix transcriptional regulator [Stutzerimonas kirkiae]TBU94608.1 transcriptional regulator [Stutzerimonas kirkiae]TBV00754.1 transcriptional regulator [Stutzerimonas kirkiae]TBV04348.1 transcriptional regulator [Stutzerimonas kirkiae]TBV12807.1 transcriptional regulator [Stutzerimonas kirkiae]